MNFATHNGERNAVVLAFLFAFILCPLPSTLPPVFASFIDLGAGARATGMGNAFTAIADDVYAVYYNPAGLSLLTRPEFAAAYTAHMAGLSDNSSMNTSFIGYAQPLGELGTAAAAWHQFDLNAGLYRDRAFYLSYGNMLLKDLGAGDLYGGISSKLLLRSFGATPEASSAMDGMLATGQADPVLAKNSVSTFDADLGLLYRLRDQYSVGLALLHVLEPDVAFSGADTDRLPVSVKLGLNRRTLLSNVGLQYETAKSPLAAMDRRLTLAVERWLPWLLVGNVGARGALTLGNREFKQASLGLSYKSGLVSVDYSFSLPINTVASVTGSHRLGFSMRFGRGPESGEESVLLLVDAMRRLKSGTAPAGGAAAGVAPPAGELMPAQRELLDGYTAGAEAFKAQARYSDALDRLVSALALDPGNTGLIKSFTRLNFIAALVRSLPGYRTDPAQKAWHQGILAYLAGNEPAAVEKVSYALSLRPDAKDIDGFLGQLEFVTGIRRAQIAGPPAPQVNVDQLLAQASLAVDGGRYREAIALCEKIIKQEPNNLAAMENLGISYFAAGDYPRWLETWEKAYELEKDPARWAALNARLKSGGRPPEQPQEYDEMTSRMLSRVSAAIENGSYREAIELGNAVLEQQPGNAAAMESLGVAYFAVGDYVKWSELWGRAYKSDKDPARWSALGDYLKSVRRSLAAQAAPAAPRVTAKPAQPAGDRQREATAEELQKLYNLGIDYYTSGKLEKAGETFEKLLRLYPGNAQAIMALQRVREEMADK